MWHIGHRKNTCDEFLKSSAQVVPTPKIQMVVAPKFVLRQCLERNGSVVALGTLIMLCLALKFST